MKAPIKYQNKIRTAHQNFLKLKEEGEMKLATLLTKLKICPSRGLGVQHPISILEGLALGVLLLTAAGMLTAVKSYADGPGIVEDHQKISES